MTNVQVSENVLQSAKTFSEKYEVGNLKEVARLFLAPTLVAKGSMNQGLKIMGRAQRNLTKNQRKTWYAVSEYILGKVY